jgi:hypothetical protein
VENIKDNYLNEISYINTALAQSKKEVLEAQVIPF